MKFIIEKAVFEKLPGVVFGAVVARVDNKTLNPDILSLLEQQVEASHNKMAEQNLREHPYILPYREAFTTLSMNPNKFICSIEALCRRVQKGSNLPSINPVVDLANAVSLKHMLPMGAHDIDKMEGNIMVRFSNPDDRFIPFGSDTSEIPDSGELIYVSGNTVKTRRWIWRQSEDGKVDETSSCILFPIDGFEAYLDRVVSARDELLELVNKHFDVSGRVGLLTANNCEMDI